MYVNNTKPYHIQKAASLSGEITICHRVTILHRLGMIDKPYGQRIAEGLDIRGLLPNHDVVEVGGGLGELAQSFIPYVRERHDISYTFLDYCPALLRAQVKANSGASAIRGDAQRLSDFVGNTDFVIANEMIGDLMTVDGIETAAKETLMGRLFRWMGRQPTAMTEYVAQAKDKYGLSGDVINLGAIWFIEQMRPVLRQGAFISENDCDCYGVEREASRISLPGHDEYSIKFPHLIKVAESLGFKVEFGNLADFAGIPEMYHIEQDDYNQLRQKMNPGLLAEAIKEKMVPEDIFSLDFDTRICYDLDLAELLMGSRVRRKVSDLREEAKQVGYLVLRV
ncbi:MAG: hypothetical protein KJ601_04445 [Nanoarchaeota archaeon]|nr:hypothetical protein [Nanoarchaeota archaeon]